MRERRSATISWRIPTPPLWLGVALSAALVVAAIVGRKARPTWAFLVVAALLALLLWSPFPADLHPGQLEMTTVDVGQGDCIFLALPDGRRMLVDGGGIPSFRGQSAARLDIGEDVVAPYLWNRGIRRLDVIVASHGHEDHIGGLPALVADFRPRELWTGAMPESAAWRKLRETAERNGVKVVSLQHGRRFGMGGVEFEVLAPFPDYVPSDTPKNNDSLVLRLRYGRHAFLLAGDIERQVEYRMLDEDGLGRVDVLKTPHHGSRTSSTQPFLAAVSPAFAVISAGFENSYGNPNGEVLDRLAQQHALVFRTDQDGLVSIRSDGRRLYVETNRQMAGRTIAPAW